MRLEVLQEFQCLAHCLNYSVAAEKMNITQPNLSKHMMELEKEIGFPLFAKDKKTNLTQPGKRYLDAVCRMLLIHNNALQQCREINKLPSEEVSILKPMIHNEGFYILNKALEEYKIGHPNCSISFKTNQHGSTLDSIFQKRTDFGIVTSSALNDDLFETVNRLRISVELIASAPLCAWIHETHPLSRKENLHWSDLREADLAFPANNLFDDMRYAGTSILTAASVFPNNTPSVYAVRNADEFYLGVKQYEVCLMTKGMSMDSSISLHEGRRLIPIDEEDAHFDFYLAWIEDTENLSVESIVEIARTIAS